MPKVISKSGKVKKFPYTKKGVASAKSVAEMTGGNMMMDENKMEMMNRPKKMKRYGIGNLKGKKNVS